MTSPKKADYLLSWSKEANEAFEMGYFNKAHKLYTLILEEIHPLDIDTRSKRSLLYLKLGMYKLAILDSQAVLKIEPSHQEAIVSNIKSLWGLRRYNEAIHVIRTKITKTQLEMPVYKDLEIKSHKFLKQSTGEYDMLEIIKLPKDECNEIGEYTGPIEIVEIPGKGRGVVATAELSPGQLVMVSKAFAIIFGIECPVSRMKALEAIVCGKLIHKDENTCYEFKKLSSCGRLNARPLPWNWPNTDDSKAVNTIIPNVSLRVMGNAFLNYATKPTSCGIWTSASSFNNDCIDANVHIQFFGDVMMIRALNKIKRGEELSVCYFKATDSANRQQFKTLRNFECNCRLCIFEATQSEERNMKRQGELNSLGLEMVRLNDNLKIQKRFEPEQVHLEMIGALEEFISSTGELTSVVQTELLRVVAKSLSTGKSDFTTAMKVFRRIANLPHDNLTINLAMFDRIIIEFALFLFRYKYFNECVEVLETARPTLNSAEGLISHILTSDQIIIFVT